MTIPPLSDSFCTPRRLLPRDAAFCGQNVVQDTSGTQYLAQISCVADNPVDKLQRSLDQCGALSMSAPQPDVLSWPTVYSGSEFTLSTAAVANATLISCLKGIEHTDNKPDVSQYAFIAFVVLPLAAAVLIFVCCSCCAARHGCSNLIRRRPRPVSQPHSPPPVRASVPAPPPPTASNLPRYVPRSTDIELALWQQGGPSVPPPAYMGHKASAASAAGTESL